jgi:hypothetical protein
MPTLEEQYPGARQHNISLPFYGVKLTRNNNSRKTGMYFAVKMSIYYYYYRSC